jgi:hypothetical protein
MLQNSFILLEGVGYRIEQRLWRQGLLCWEDFLEWDRVRGFSPRLKERYDRELEEARRCLIEGRSSYFREKLKPRDAWRLYQEFRDSACFLDIETTGLSPGESEVTVVGVSDGREVKTFIKGVNLTQEALAREISRHGLLVTFYGAAFDLPFLRRKFPALRLDIPHIDLCFAGRRAGLRGGLKVVERELGIERMEDIEGVDGLEAVRLWRRWEREKDPDALHTLVEYNRADTANLKPLAEEVYRRLRDSTFIEKTS